MIVRRARHHLLPLVGFALIALAACQENLSGGAACPTLCPGQQLEVHDTILVATEVFDTSAIVTGMPPLGTETQLLVARYADSAGDSVVSGAVLRYDSLQRNFPQADTTKPIVPVASVSSAILQFTSTPDTSIIRDSMRFEVIDVDANVPDLDTATIHQLFLTRPALGTLNVNKDSVATQHSLSLDTAFIRQHVTTGTRVRLGVRIFSYGHAGTNSVQVGILPITSVSSTSGAQTGSSLQYMGHAAAPATDSLNFVNFSLSKSSGGPEFRYLANYQLVLKGSPPAPAGVLPVGGLPSSRVYLRFNLPTALIDSSTTIVRATLLLHQRGDPTFSAVDSVSLTPRVVIASPNVTDVSKAALLLAEPTTVPLPAVRMNPNETRIDSLVLVSKSASVVTLWRAEGPLVMQRALVLQSSGEGRDPRRFLIYTNAALPDSLRPQLHLTYIPRSGFGLP
ncbi:MAG TPA: hypothetical protein VGO46_16125 [Gemmatimonadaceae bacterium]|jgi:hypothetical protein|nr:hypothetical protein [Gemmatimonadaceae bacterium]